MPDRQLPITPGMSLKRMWEACRQVNIMVCSRVLPGSLMGFYTEREQTIILDSGLSSVQSKCTLVHELFHWQYADETSVENVESRCERRTRRLTALFLIDPEAYKLAEALCEGDVYGIATELNVTPFIVRDYRDVLESATIPVPGQTVKG